MKKNRFVKCINTVLFLQEFYSKLLAYEKSSIKSEVQFLTRNYSSISNKIQFTSLSIFCQQKKILLIKITNYWANYNWSFKIITLLGKGYIHNYSIKCRGDYLFKGHFDIVFIKGPYWFLFDSSGNVFFPELLRNSIWPRPLTWISISVVILVST